MPDTFPDPESRIRAVAALIAERGPMTLLAVARELGLTRPVAERVLSLPLFERAARRGRGLPYRLTEAGRRVAEGRV